MTPQILSALHSLPAHNISSGIGILLLSIKWGIFDMWPQNCTNFMLCEQ